MESFLKFTSEENKFELLIDKNIFWKDIILKASYNFLDRGHFFFKLDKNENIILQFTKKQDCDFSDELLAVYLRDKLERDNKVIREAIVTAAIWNSLDTRNFIELNTSENKDSNINFDKDIDDILKEIESDPDLKIDWSEIEKILKEIEGDLNQSYDKSNSKIDKK